MQEKDFSSYVFMVGNMKKVSEAVSEKNLSKNVRG